MLARRFTDHDDQPVEDKIVVLKGATWADYQRHLEMRGEKGSPRLAYLEGVLEIMTPSLPHETIKSVIGRLVEVWCLERGIEFTPCGVGEVWFWRRGRFSVHALRDQTYQEIPRSEVLAGIDLEALASFLDRPTASQAIRDYRASLQPGG